MWKRTIFAVVCAALLAALAMGSGSAFGTTSRDGSPPVEPGALRIEQISDQGLKTDPALAYVGIAGEFEYATCATLLNYPDAAGPAGTRLRPRSPRRCRRSLRTG